jgi:hypothetical protein
MQFKYKKKKLYTNLIIGILWVVIGVASLLFNEDSNWTDYGFFSFGLVYIGFFLFNYKFQYITVKNGIIQENGLFGKKVEIAKITSFRKLAGDYVLIAGKNQLRINTELIDADSLVELKKYISSLGTLKEQ